MVSDVKNTRFASLKLYVFQYPPLRPLSLRKMYTRSVCIPFWTSEVILEFHETVFEKQNMRLISEGQTGLKRNLEIAQCVSKCLFNHQSLCSHQSQCSMRISLGLQNSYRDHAVLRNWAVKGFLNYFKRMCRVFSKRYM